MKSKEELLLEELRSFREIGLRISQWGITVLIGLQTVIYYIRKDVRETLIANKLLDAKAVLPEQNYRIGTIDLFVVALIFFMFTLFIVLNVASVRRL